MSAFDPKRTFDESLILPRTVTESERRLPCTHAHARAREIIEEFPLVNLYGISENAQWGAEAPYPRGKTFRHRGHVDPRNLGTVATANKRALHQLSRIARKVRPIENPPADPAKYTGKSDQASYRCRGDLLFGSYLDQIENVAEGRLEPR
jgi:hypothetical protein